MLSIATERSPGFVTIEAWSTLSTRSEVSISPTQSRLILVTKEKDHA